MKEKNTILKGILSFIIVILLIKVCWQIGPGEGILGEKIENKMDVIPSFITYEVGNGESLTQTFIPSYGYMNQFKILLLQVGDDRTGNLNVHIDNEAGETLWSKDMPIADLKAGEWMPVEVESRVPANRICKLTFQAENNVEPVLFMLANRAFDTEENQILLATSGQEVAGGMLVTFDYQLTLRKTTKLIYCLIACMIACILLICIYEEHPLQFLKRECYCNGELRTSVYIVCFCILAGLFYFTHIYRLFDTPYGLHIDEAGMGYDAWSLANFGTDRYLKQYPVYLINFGGGQSALHAYLVAFLIKIFGYSEKLFRIPALMNAVVMLVTGALLVKNRWKNRTVVVLFMGLYMIFPVFIMFTRFGFDCNLMMGMSCLLLLTLVMAVQKQDIGLYILSGIVAGITLYTYVISYLILPVFLFLMLLYLAWCKKVDWKQVIGFTIPLAILAMPLILEQIINIFQLPEIHLGAITIPRMLSYRSKELSIQHYWGNLYETLKCTFWNDMWNYDSIPDFKMMYWLTIPFAIVGICQAGMNSYRAVCNKEFHIDTMILCYFSCVFFTGGLLDGGSGLTCYKINSIYMPVLFFVLQGMITLYQKLNTEPWIPAIVAIMVIYYGVSFGQFTDYYYGKEYHDGMIPSFFFDHTYKDAIAEVQRLGLEDSERPICVEAERSNRIYFYASKMISPLEQVFDKEIESYHNYYFVSKDNLTVDVANAYILSPNSRSFAIELEKNGMIVNKIGENYLCY